MINLHLSKMVALQAIYADFKYFDINSSIKVTTYRPKHLHIFK